MSNTPKNKKRADFVKASRTTTYDFNIEQFPVDALPEVARSMVRSVSETRQTPAGMVACAALATASLAIGKGLYTKALLDIETSANLYIVVGGSAGAGKSLAFRPIFSSVANVQTLAWGMKKALGNPRESSAGEEIEDTKSSARAARKASDGLTEGDTAHRLLLQQEPIPNDTEANPMLYTEDATIPAIAKALAENRQCLGSFSSDARDLIKVLVGGENQPLGKEGLFLKGFSGDSCNILRVKKQIYLDSPCISIFWMTQLDRLDDLFANLSLSDGGFLSRCLVGRFELQISKIPLDPKPLDTKHKKKWDDLVLDLLYHYRLGESRNAVVVSQEAQAVLRDFQHHTADRLNQDLLDIQAYTVRQYEQCVRIALVLHALKNGSDSHNHVLAEQTANDAVRICDWFLAQQLELVADIRNKRREKTRECILNVLRKMKEEGVTARFLQQRRVAASKGEIIAELDRMIKDQLVERIEKRAPTRGGHATTMYRMRPAVAEQPLRDETYLVTNYERELTFASNQE